MEVVRKSELKLRLFTSVFLVLQTVIDFLYYFPDFKEAMPLIEESINKADFFSIDTEFTGLINGRDVSMFDTPGDYYTRLLSGSAEFMLIQFGLCAFYWDKEKKQYMNDAYNFFLFPRARPGPDRMFLCQSSSLDFLAANGFDFNKLIREGKY